MRNQISIMHHFDDYECMWNGVEDLYIHQAGEKLPPSFFFVLSSFGTFCYTKDERSKLKRMITLNVSSTEELYAFLSPVVGFDYKFYECKDFQTALAKTKAEIDAGFACVLGALDMYYLPYFEKLYHAYHIPIHYVLAVGYDDENHCIYVHDCGRQKAQPIPYGDLRLAWDCAYPGLSKPNTVCTIRMHSDKNKYEIAKEAFARRSAAFLNPPTDFMGYKGFKTFIDELPKWKTELPKNDYDKILFNMVQFFGTVPTVPNALRGVEQPDEVAFGGGFDKASTVLAQLGIECGNDKMKTASVTFEKGAEVIAKIKDIIVNYLLDVADRTGELPALFSEALDAMKSGFEILK